MTSVRLDIEAYMKAKQRRVNISGLCNNALKVAMDVTEDIKDTTPEDMVIALKAKLMNAEAELNKQRKKEERDREKPKLIING